MMRVSPWTFVGTVAAALTLTASTSMAQTFCGDPASGDCCLGGSGTPFCNDADCCNTVCGIDPFCCSVEWDSICATEAASFCVLCGAVPCDVDCSGATAEEGELCGEDINGGCNSPSPITSPIDVGDIVCGQYWADGSIRDTDWYEFTITDNMILTFSVQGEIQSNIFLLTAGCPATVIQSAAGAAGSCDPVTMSDVCVPAGTYWVVVVPAFFSGFPCDQDKHYLLSIADTGLVCTPPAGDSCADAIETTEGDTAFDTNGAFTNGDPLPPECASFGSVTIFNDLWYKFTASTDGLYKVSTCNQADFDTRLAIYSGDCLAPTIVGCNDDGAGCSGFTSEMIVSLSAGTEYLVRVGGYGAGGGTGVLSINPFQGCDVACPEGSHIEAELCGEDTNGGCNAGGIFEDVTAPGTVCGTFWADGSFRDTDWFRFNLAEPTEVTLTVNSTLNVTIGLLSANCSPLVIYAIDATQSCGATITACLPAGENVAFVALASFSGTPCGAGDLNSYTATISLGGACVPLACGSSPNDCCTASLDGSPFCSDETCCNQVCTFDPFCCSVAWDSICAGEANSTCAVCGVVAPPNDECAAAEPITDGDTAFSTIGASTSEPPLDPSCEEGFGLNFVNDIWFSYVATCSGDTTFSLCNLVDYDSRIALYSGDCSNLQIVACNDDGTGCGLTSSMTASLTEGQTYYLRVGGFSGSGSGTIHIECGGGGGGPENDDCSGAIPVVVGANAYSNIGATGVTQMDPGACTFFGSSVIYNDVWFTYTATGDGDVEISTCSAVSFDTRIAVFSDCSLAQTIACNDDTTGCANFTTKVNFTGQCGVTYYISIGAYSATGFGTGTVTVTQSGTCASPCPADLNDDGVVGPADLALLLGAWGTAGPGDLDNSGSVGAPDLALLLGAWGPCP